ncbi:hypothetical protein GCM10027612_19470 [Microbispora bryophytorum subsp. camponoti]
MTVSTILRAPFRKGFLGYWVASASGGRGHATRAVSRILTVMTEELGLHRAEAHTRMDNLASQRVLRVNGFQPWGSPTPTSSSTAHGMTRCSGSGRWTTPPRLDHCLGHQLPVPGASRAVA